ncbi:MAG: hypothetical protein MI861_05770 [Pirellulales bacterium]|nr:hypothetical protein [Pirellulales bacterium]
MNGLPVYQGSPIRGIVSTQSPVHQPRWWRKTIDTPISSRRELPMGVVKLHTSTRKLVFDSN